MLIVGDIGGTKTRLALVSAEAGPRKFVAEQEFHSADFNGLQPVVEAFLAKTGGHPMSACFDSGRTGHRRPDASDIWPGISMKPSYAGVSASRGLPC